MDMSRFVDNWKVGEAPPHNPDGPMSFAYLECPSDKSVTVEILISGATPPEKGKILIAQGVCEGEELWAIRMLPFGRLVLQLGTAAHRETLFSYRGDMKLSLSYNPTTGAISLITRPLPFTDVNAEILAAHALNPWVRYVQQHDKPPRESWQLCLGCPQDGRADKPPLGWTISAGFRFGESLGFPEPEELRRLASQRQADLHREYFDCIGVIHGTEATGKISIPSYRTDRSTLHHDRVYDLAAEGADHQQLSAEWHIGVLAGARAMGWKGGAV